MANIKISAKDYKTLITTGAVDLNTGDGIIHHEYNPNTNVYEVFNQDEIEQKLNDYPTFFQAESTYQKKNIYKQNLQIAISDWVEEQEPVHEGYPYRCDVPVAESTVNHYPEPIFDDITERERKVFSKCETGTGVLKIWSKEPVVATIETLKLEVSI
ncbi:MAG: hypothetical protein IJ731_09010 [Eubacterium sp.]|nr:hypothetical protein [Eubacterium sp.]